MPGNITVDLAEALAPGCQQQEIGIRPGEKLHEVLVTSDESRHCYDQGDRFVIVPEHMSWASGLTDIEGERPPDGFAYTSDSNDRWVSLEELRELAADVQPATV